jgi:hypothetical protein
VKSIVRIFWVTAVVTLACQLPAKAESKFVQLSKLPGNCKDGKPSPEAKFSFGLEMLVIDSTEQAATANLELGRGEFSLYQRIRDTSYLVKSKTHMNDALAQLQKNLDERFELADAALSAGCFSLADDGYRDVIKTHVGSDYQAARDRAKVGIDDVRAKLAK